jgi:glyoxylase-like metal-dependent hydrolase (beta-lactamase superfamily II)
MEETPIIDSARPVAPDTEIITTHASLPGLGALAVNAFLIRAQEPVLIDTGIGAFSEATFAKITDAIDPEDLRWIWLTHTDGDHVGSLHRLLQAAPHARVVTTFLGMGKLGLQVGVPPERAYLLNPGQSLDVGDRTLHALRPPTFDAPETTGVFDAKTRVLFSADSFGAVLPELALDARDLDAEALKWGLCTWSQIDAPWLSWLDDASFAALTGPLRELKPTTVLSSHLPPAPGMLERLLALLQQARSATPFVGPDQQALVAMLKAA